jgi:hypothetical protein
MSGALKDHGDGWIDAECFSLSFSAVGGAPCREAPNWRPRLLDAATGCIFGNVDAYFMHVD